MKYKLNFIAGTIILLLALGSCESYLDKAPEATITEKDAFGNFKSFQGFVEELYNCVTDPNKAGAWNQYLFADEVLGNGIYAFDQGNYWSQSSYLYGTTIATENAPRTKRMWPLAWYAIRKANLALAKLPLMVDATQEEKNLIEGQALFFRGFFYFELMKWWGGLPYIDTVLDPLQDLRIPRLNYRETALKAADDLRAAADLLPIHWDSTLVGKQATLGNNNDRINKIFALGYLGKDLLYAASPMMNEESTGSATFDADLCKQAAAAFAELIKVNETNPAKPIYKIQTWATWTDNFWVWSPGNTSMSGGTEVIMNCTVFDNSRVRWSTVGQTCPATFGGNTSTVEVPTWNYLKNYAMSDGLPIGDSPLYKPAEPWANREPRFYSDIIVDGDKMVASAASGVDQFAQLNTGGRHRASSNGSVTGFYYKRYSPIGCNTWDAKWDAFQAYVPFLRLADVYLMYAEAVLQGYGSASSSDPGLPTLTAEGAINIVRNRAQLPNISAAYTATKDKFMGEIIRERAVELAFEGARFQDLRRWNLNFDPKYKDKTALDFDRDPVTKKPINIKERVVITRVAEKKHNWLPFQVSFTKQYEGFQQNPGW